MADDAASATSITNKALSSDKGLLEALQMNERDAAKALGRSRQSLYQAKLEERTDYFKGPDIRTLVFKARSSKPDLDLSKISEYIERTRSEELVAEIQTLGTQYAEETTLAAYKELWIVIPDFSYFEHKRADTVKMFSRLSAREGGVTRFFTSSTLDKRLLEQRLKNAHNQDISIAVEPWMGGIPYLIIGNPDGEADSYLFTSGRYVLHEWYGGSKLVLLIKSFFEKPKIPAETPALDADQDDVRLVGVRGR